MPRLNCRHHSTVAVAVVVAASLSCLASPIQAADLPVYKAPPPAMPMLYSWSGFYIGGQVGYAWGRDHTYETLTSTGAFTGFEWRYDMNSVVGGLFAGANYQVGATVFGLEADIEAAGNKGGFYDPPGAGDTNIKWQGSVRGRLGFAADNVLFYATGGLAYADISHTYTEVFTPVSETTRGTRVGWTAGVGIDYAMTQNLLARVEYRYADYGSYKYDSLTAFPGLTGEQSPVVNTVRLGLAYKF
jgi:outer membrane immunogenic protein